MAQATAKIRDIVARYIENLTKIDIPVERVYLFGSQIRLEADNESDVDLAVISSLFERMSLWDRAGYLGKAAWDIPFRWCLRIRTITGEKSEAWHALVSHIEKWD